jgi:hypothetical protein
MQGWLQAAWLRFAYTSSVDVHLSIVTDQGANYTVVVPSSGGIPAKFFAWLPAVSQGKSMKFKLMEWIANANADAFTVYGADCELALKPWGDQSGFREVGGYRVIRPFRQGDGSTT